MKKIILGLISLASLTACSLDETPYTVSSEELANSQNGAEQLVTGIYNCFWDSYMMKKTYMEWLDMDHDHAGAESWVMSGAGEGNVTTHWGYNNSSDLWNVFYQMISRANKAMESIAENGDLTQNRTISQLYGEALFLRAWAYFHLVRMYGAVPLRLAYIQENDLERSPVKTVFEQIVEDLKQACDYMSYRSEGSVGEWGHADKTAAQLLLAKVLCTMGSGSRGANGIEMIVPIKGTDIRYSSDREALAGYREIDAEACYRQAKELCDEILKRKGVDYDLMPAFTDVWGTVNARNKEFIWGVASSSSQDYQTEHLAIYYSMPPFGGQRRCFMAEGLYDQYEQQDHRLVYGVFHYFATGYDNMFSYGWVPYPNETEYSYEAMPENLKSHCSKWYGNFAKSTPTIAKWYIGDLQKLEPRMAVDGNSVQEDIPLLRFAEVYLLKAEAEIELGNVSAGIDAVNEIRRRARASELPQTSDVVEARSWVFKERSLELVAEFNRKFDLLRWGLYLDVMNGTVSVKAYGYTNSKVRERRNLLYAVPTAEVTENKLFGPNNPGW